MKSFKERNPVVLGVVGTLVLATVTALVFSYQDLPAHRGRHHVPGGVHRGRGAAPGRRGAGRRHQGRRGHRRRAGPGRAGDRVLVSFRVQDAWIGDSTTAAIKLKTLLGRKFLALFPTGRTTLGPGAGDPARPHGHPVRRDRRVRGPRRHRGRHRHRRSWPTASPRSPTRSPTRPSTSAPRSTGSPRCRRRSPPATPSSPSCSATPARSPARCRVPTTSSTSSSTTATCCSTELSNRREAIHDLLTGTTDLAGQLSGLVADNQRQLAPALSQLDSVTGILQRYTKNIDQSLKLAGPYFRAGEQRHRQRPLDRQLPVRPGAGGQPEALRPAAHPGGWCPMRTRRISRDGRGARGGHRAARCGGSSAVTGTSGSPRTSPARSASTPARTCRCSACGSARSSR